jgi:hypothetical protein
MSLALTARWNRILSYITGFGKLSAKISWKKKFREKMGKIKNVKFRETKKIREKIRKKNSLQCVEVKPRRKPRVPSVTEVAQHCRLELDKWKKGKEAFVD